MAAAVADFRPSRAAEQKLKKEDGAPTLALEPTPDILTGIAEQRRESGCPKVVVGFAAETQDLIENAQAKLKAKGMDLIVANDVTARDSGFSVDTNRVVLLDTWGETQPLPLLGKSEVARRVVERVGELLSAKGESSR
jgi:phosphopantothenoylcysteine decarboxylase/phosphopantothenate--cysteine ligase